MPGIEARAPERTDTRSGLLHLGTQQLDDGLLAVTVIFGAHFGSYGEARRYGDTYQIHFGKIGALAAEKLSHFSVTLGLLVAEGVDTFYVCHKFRF